MHPAIPITLVFVGCCSNVIFLEGLTKVYPSSGNLITFFAFLFNCLEGLFITTRFLTKPTNVPIKYYLIMVSLFFVVQTLNNYTLGFNISMPLHMILRAGSLIANLIMGVLFLKKSYKPTKYLSVVFVTIGIIACTIASARQKEKMASQTGDEVYDYFIWMIGVGLVVLSLFLSAFMGIFQEKTYSKYGKHPAEALFYNHFLPLPLFFFFTSDIMNTFQVFSNSEPVALPVLNISVPWALLFIALNTITQFVCIRCVFILTSECASLTVTLVVTLRKFISLVFSIYYFNNPFTPTHWVGAVLVFVGTILFVDILSRFSWYRQLEASLGLAEKKEEKKKE